MEHVVERLKEIGDIIAVGTVIYMAWNIDDLPEPQARVLLIAIWAIGLLGFPAIFF